MKFEFRCSWSMVNRPDIGAILLQSDEMPLHILQVVRFQRTSCIILSGLGEPFLKIGDHVDVAERICFCSSDTASKKLLLDSHDLSFFLGAGSSSSCARSRFSGGLVDTVEEYKRQTKQASYFRTSWKS
jgi:hypothetical protein